MYPSAGRALHTLGRKVGGARAPSAPPGSAASAGDDDYLMNETRR